MIEKKYKFDLGIVLLALILIFVLQSCSNTAGRLGGGPKDEIPPSLIIEKSTPNYSTFFKERKIELVFDEFITARSLLSKTIISPPLAYIPKMEAKGKKVTIEFEEKEVFKENATYIFNFGDAIVDFREGNKLENFAFVFSTGAVIDSLSMSGKVYDAFSREPVPEMYVMLYDDTRDSVVYQDKPFYFAITDKEGKFSFQNLRSDTFKVFALKDANLNYIYDQPTELIGYLDTLINLVDTLINNLSIEVFQEGITYRFLKVFEAKNGVIKLTFSENLKEKPEINLPDNFVLLYSEIKKDTFLLHHNTRLDSIELIIMDDTLKIRPILDTTFLASLFLPAGNNRQLNQLLSPLDSVSIIFNSPIDYVIDSMIIISDSTHHATSKWVRSENTIKGVGNWKVDSLYNVFIPPGCVYDVYGRTNDTISFTLQSQNIEKYGDIIVDLLATKPGVNYVLKVIKDSKTLKTSVFSGGDSTQVIFKTLLPAEYSLSLLEDNNNNGKWDAGSYRKRTHSERIKTLNLEKLRENWELMAKIEWNKE